MDLHEFFQNFNPIRGQFDATNTGLSIYYPLSMIVIGFLLRKIGADLRLIFITLLSLQIYLIYGQADPSDIYLMGYACGFILLGFLYEKYKV